MLCCRTQNFSGQKYGIEVETRHLTVHSGMVTLVPAIVEADLAEVPPDENDYNAPTSVSRDRGAEVPDFPSNCMRSLISLVI